MNIDGFEKVIDTLKLYRRAELIDDEGRHLIDQLYIDPLPNEQVLKNVLKPNTTFLIGRKGTGKSTIFQKAQSNLNLNSQYSWAYIDIKTIFESSTSELVIPEDYKELDNAMSLKSIKKLLVFKNFVHELVKEIRNQIDSRIDTSIWERIKDAFSGTREELFIKLDEFILDLNQNEFLNISMSRVTKEIDLQANSSKVKSGVGLDAKAAMTGASVSLNIISELIEAAEKSKTENYSEVFLKVFNIQSLVKRLEEILINIGIKHLFVFVDDFSELSKNDIEEVVDTILVPFNNWSNDFIKLKVAMYPGRLYFGNIDKTKVDEIYLDIYRAYGRSDVSVMEESAIDFTRRLLTQRLEKFCPINSKELLDLDSEDFWRVLFFTCMGNPRSLGYILYYCYETHSLYQKKIGISALQDAARRYYEEKIFEYFRLNKFLHESYEERSSIFSLKELFEQIVKRSKELRTYRGSKLTSDLAGRTPSSHFHCISEYDSILSTLELNFFLTKFYEMKDRDGRDVSVYALHYGLCQQQSIAYGRPREKREHRLYFVERIFDYSAIITSYIAINQEIACDQCGSKYGNDMLNTLAAYNMLCPKCRIGQCKIVNLSKKYENLVRSVSGEILLPRTDLGILKALHDSREKMFAKEIASELDCSYQLIGKRGKYLQERQLIRREENQQGRRTFAIDKTADDIYFQISDDDRLDIGETEIAP